MADYQEEDLFDDLYDDEPASKPTPAAAPPKAEPEVTAEVQSAVPQETPQEAAPAWQEPAAGGVDTNMAGSAFNNGGNQSYHNAQNDDDNYGPINVKEDG
ncbi:hypothetical protein SLS59_001347 [Nothophoma quercina]|uniref:Clathrin light chain n=1 Tax=Nothophoma quercina TaxID=749835 RepID=A0ABR3RZJ6_9PLEO